MSGFEIAGVVLGVLPLLISGGSQLMGQLDSAMNAHSVAKTDTSIREFYQDFGWETFEMKKSLETVIRGLANISEDQKDRILSGEYNEWYNDSTISDALEVLLGSEDNLSQFKEALTQVLELFCKLIGEKSSKLPGDRIDHTAMCKAMRNFQSSEVDWGFLERRKFFREHENRQRWLRKLRTWNRRLRKVIHYSNLNSTGTKGQVLVSTVASTTLSLQVFNVQPQKPSKPPAADTSSTSSSSAQLRDLSRRLFTALATLWPLQCNCGPTLVHKACFCLQNCTAIQEDEPGGGSGSQAATGVHSVEFSFFVSDLPQTSKTSNSATFGSNLRKTTPTPSRGNQAGELLWHEATVAITNSCSKSMTNSTGRSEMMKEEDICRAIAAIREARPHGLAAFRLNIEDHGHTQTIFTPNIEPAQLQYGSLLPANITLDKLFAIGGRKPGLAIRLKLASILAKSLFQLHESPCPSSRWCKTNIAFFYKSCGEIDFSRPFLSIPEFEETSGSRLFKKDATDPSLMHKSPGILRLGILLIELFNWKRIEDCQKAAAAKKPQRNSSGDLDIFVAIRALEKMDASSRIKSTIPNYLELIRACLKVRWIISGKDAGSLDNETTRKGFYQSIIKPLQEIEDSLENGKNISLVNKMWLKTL